MLILYSITLQINFGFCRLLLIIFIEKRCLSFSNNDTCLFFIFQAQAAGIFLFLAGG